MVQSYLDDDVLGGEAKDVFADFGKLITSCGRIGLEFSIAKCELAVLGGSASDRQGVQKLFLNAFPELTIPARKDFTYLGSPLTDEAIGPALERSIASASFMMKRLKILPAHQAFHLLRVCMGPTKILHLLRSGRAYKNLGRLQEFDVAVRDCLTEITNNNIEKTAWIQATLPISMGGIGIRRACELALPPFWHPLTRVKT